MKSSRKYFVLIADVVRQLGQFGVKDSARGEVAKTFANRLEREFPSSNFNKEKFLEACGQ